MSTIEPDPDKASEDAKEDKPNLEWIPYDDGAMDLAEPGNCGGYIHVEDAGDLVEVEQ